MITPGLLWMENVIYFLWLVRRENRFVLSLLPFLERMALNSRNARVDFFRWGIRSWTKWRYLVVSGLLWAYPVVSPFLPYKAKSVLQVTSNGNCSGSSHGDSLDTCGLENHGVK